MEVRVKGGEAKRVVLEKPLSWHGTLETRLSIPYIHFSGQFASGASLIGLSVSLAAAVAAAFENPFPWLPTQF